MADWQEPWQARQLWGGVLGLEGWLGVQGADKEMGPPAGMTGTSVCLWVLGGSHTRWGDRQSSQKCREQQIPVQDIN